MRIDKAGKESRPLVKRISGIRIAVYIGGMVSVSLGIVLCAQCGLGISPISSIAFVSKEILPFSFGQLTMLFHLMNILLQMLLLQTVTDKKLLLQIPVAFIFGWLIDLIKTMIIIDQNQLLLQLLALACSIFFTALGMVMMVKMDMVQNPPDGFVKCLAAVAEKKFGHVKIFYDVVCVVISIAMGMLFLHRPYGMGIATITSALFVGKTVIWIQKTVEKRVTARINIEKLKS